MTTIKNIKSLLVLAAIAFLPTASFAQAFEGVIDMNTTNKDIAETAKVKWYIKNGNSKMVIDATVKGVTAQYSVIFKKGDPEAHIVMQDAVSNVPVSQLLGKTEIQIGPSGAAKGVGEKTVAGFPCVSLINNRGQVTAWATDKAGITAEDLPELMRNQGTLSILNALGIKGIPLEITQYNDKGEVKMTQSITAIHKTAVSDNEFDTSKYRSLEQAVKEMNSK